MRTVRLCVIPEKRPRTGGDDAVDVETLVGPRDLERFVVPHLARFGDALQQALEAGDDFLGAQADHFRVRRDLSVVRGEVDEPRVREIEAQLVGRDDGDADRRGLEHRFESHARVDFAAGQLFGGAMTFLRDARELAGCDWPPRSAPPPTARTRGPRRRSCAASAR